MDFADASIPVQHSESTYGSAVFHVALQTSNHRVQPRSSLGALAAAASVTLGMTLLQACAYPSLMLDPLCRSGKAAYLETGYLAADQYLWLRVAEAHAGSSGQSNDADHVVELAIKLEQSASSQEWSLAEIQPGYLLWGAGGPGVLFDILENRTQIRLRDGALFVRGTLTVRERSTGEGTERILCQGACTLEIRQLSISENTEFACGLWSEGYLRISPIMQGMEPEACAGKEEVWRNTLGSRW